MGRVIVPDVVALEATRLPDKPWAPEIATWFAAAAVEVVQTDLGAVYRLALANGLELPRKAGELAIVEWVAEELLDRRRRSGRHLEDTLVPTLITDRSFKVEVSAVTTVKFRESAEAKGTIFYAEAAWDTISSAALNC